MAVADVHGSVVRPDVMRERRRAGDHDPRAAEIQPAECRGQERRDRLERQPGAKEPLERRHADRRGGVNGPGQHLRVEDRRVHPGGGEESRQVAGHLLGATSLREVVVDDRDARGARVFVERHVPDVRVIRSQGKGELALAKRRRSSRLRHASGERRISGPNSESSASWWWW